MIASKKPLLKYSTQQARATLVSAPATLTSRMPRRSRVKTRSRSAASIARRRRNSRTKVRLVKGRVTVRVNGVVRRLGASQLIKFVPITRIRAAAKRLIGKTKPRRRVNRRRRYRKRQ